MWALGLARRLWTQAGLTSAPAKEPTMIIAPSMVRYANGDSRGCPDFAPVVVSSSSVAPWNGPPTVPPFERNSSTMRALNAFRSASRAAALGRRGGGKMGPCSSGTP